MAESTTQPRLLKLSDVAVLLGVPTATVLVMARSGELPAVRIGKRDPWRVDRRRLEEHFDELRAKAAVREQPQGPSPLKAGATSSKGSAPRAANRAASMAPPSSTPERPAKAVKETRPGAPLPTNPRGLPQDAKSMTVGEAAELLRVSWPTVIRRINEGAFGASKIDRRWRASTADVESALMQKKVARLMAKRARRRSRLRGL